MVRADAQHQGGVRRDDFDGRAVRRGGLEIGGAQNRRRGHHRRQNRQPT